MSVKRVWKVQQKRKNWHERDGKWSEKDIVSFDRTKRTGLASACKWLAQIFTWNTAIRLGISSPNKQRFSTFLHALPTALRAIFIFFAVHSKLCKLKDFEIWIKFVNTNCWYEKKKIHESSIKLEFLLVKLNLIVWISTKNNWLNALMLKDKTVNKHWIVFTDGERSLKIIVMKWKKKLNLYGK